MIRLFSADQMNTERRVPKHNTNEIAIEPNDIVNQYLKSSRAMAGLLLTRASTQKGPPADADEKEASNVIARGRTAVQHYLNGQLAPALPLPAERTVVPPLLQIPDTNRHSEVQNRIAKIEKTIHISPHSRITFDSIPQRIGDTISSEAIATLLEKKGYHQSPKSTTATISTLNRLIRQFGLKVHNFGSRGTGPAYTTILIDPTSEETVIQSIEEAEALFAASKKK